MAKNQEQIEDLREHLLKMPIERVIELTGWDTLTQSEWCEEIQNASPEVLKRISEILEDFEKGDVLVEIS